MTFVTKGYVKLTEGQIHYRVSGDANKPALVMLHQTASASVMFERLMHSLPDFYIIAPDTPGYGASFDPSHAPTISYYAEILHTLLREMRIETCHIFGHHTGAAIAAQFAHDYPDMVDKLILGGPPYLSDTQKESLSKTLSTGALPDDGSHLIKTWQRIHSRSLSGDLDLIHRETLLTLRATKYHQTYQAVFAHDFAALLPQIICSTLVICGEQDTIRASAEPTHEALSNSELVIVPDAGTYICDENTDTLAEVIRNFLK